MCFNPSQVGYKLILHLGEEVPVPRFQSLTGRLQTKKVKILSLRI